MLIKTKYSCKKVKPWHFWQNHGIRQKSWYPWFPCYHDYLLSLVMYQSMTLLYLIVPCSSWCQINVNVEKNQQPQYQQHWSQTVTTKSVSEQTFIWERVMQIVLITLQRQFFIIHIWTSATIRITAILPSSRNWLTTLHYWQTLLQQHKNIILRCRCFI